MDVSPVCCNFAYKLLTLVEGHGHILDTYNRMLYCLHLFTWGFTSLSTLYRSYHDGYLEGQRKPVHKVHQGSVL